MMSIPLFALSGLFIAVSSALMAVVMAVLGRARLHFLWSFFCLSVFIWGIGGYFIGTTADAAQADRLWRLTHIGVAFIPVIFLHFVYVFLNLKRVKTIFVFYALAALFAYLAVYSDLLIAHMRFVFGEFYYDSPPGLLYPLFTTYFFGLTIFSHVILYLRFRDKGTTGTAVMLDNERIRYFFLGMLLSFAGGSLSFFPVYGLDVYPLGNFMVTLYPLIIGYAILRHQLFDIRVAAAQGLTALLWIFVGVRFMLSESPEEARINGALLVIVVILGIFLVRSVNKEIYARARSDKLAEELANSNRSLEMANEQLKELDQLKSEFVSLATHQIRGPIAAIKGYASLLLEGDYGSVPEVCRKPLETILQSSAALAGVVQDFLDVSRIEQGRMKYEITVFDFGKLVRTVAEELAPSIERKGLRIRLEIADGILIHADAGKLRQVIENLIDNALKYTASGSVAVRVKKQEGTVRLEVSDTGVGIPKETLPHLFKKFSRASDASKANIKGTGLGLYIARQLIEAQRGTIRAESAGENRGSMFIVELPLHSQP